VGVRVPERLCYECKQGNCGGGKMRSARNRGLRTGDLSEGKPPAAGPLCTALISQEGDPSFSSLGFRRKLLPVKRCNGKDSTSLLVSRRKVASDLIKR